MKLAISQKTLLSMLSKGGAAAVSKIHTADNSAYAPLLKSVKISATDNEISFESINRSFSLKHIIPATKENGIDVKEAGIAVVHAQELQDWVSKQSGAIIGLNLVKLDIPEMVSGKKSKDDDFHKNDVIRKIGVLKVTSKDSSRTGAKWSMDSLDDTQFPKPRESTEVSDLFSISKKNMVNALSSISFSAQLKDTDHIFDCVCISSSNGGIYAATTDALRCSTYNLSNLISEKGPYWDTAYNDKMGARVLIPLLSLDTIIDTLSEDSSSPIKFLYCKDKNYVKIVQDSVSAYISIKDFSMFIKFPNINGLIMAKSREIGSIPKNIFLSRLITSSLVNKDSALFQFKNNEFKIHVISDAGKPPNTSTCPVEDMKFETKHIWGVQHLAEALKVLKDDNVMLYDINNGNGFKIQSKVDSNATYFGVVISNSKYNNLEVI